MKRRRWDTTGWSETALRIERQLQQNQEPAIEDLLALVAEMRDMVVPPEWRVDEEPPEDATSRLAAASSVDEFESNVLREALLALHEDVVDIRNAHHEVLTGIALDGYHHVQDACAHDPENDELARLEKKMRAILEKDLGGPIPTRDELEAERQWEEEDETT